MADLTGSSVSKNLIEVLESEGIILRRRGRELVGLCPFHEDTNPSLSVNEQKQLWHCFACNEGGDAIRFIEKLHGVDFKSACKILGINETNSRPKPHGRKVSREAREITAWANSSFLRAQAKLRGINCNLHLAQRARWKEEVERLCREFQIISILADDLQTPALVIAMHRDPDARAWVERLVADAPEEPLPTFPELTAEYLARLKKYVRGHE